MVHNQCLAALLLLLRLLVLQAALQDVSAVGVTPRELGVIALNCLLAWEASGGQQIGPLQPEHLQAALKGYISSHSSRVSR